MRIEVITIGDEILSGTTLNTNFQYIAEKVSSCGVSVSKHTVCSDEKNELKQTLSDVTQRAKIVITTGGLGPTLDDCTKNILAEFFCSSLRVDEEVKMDLIQRYGHHETIQSQSTVPTNADILKNTIGTAPGFCFQKDGLTLFSLPGVPIEMAEMLETQVIPHLQKLLIHSDKVEIRRISMWNMSENMISPLIENLNRKYPHVQFGIYPGFGILKIAGKSSVKNEKDLDSCFEILKNEYKTQVFCDTFSSVEMALHQLLVKEKKTLVLAESLTGGHIAAKLTNLPGASNYFLGSIVSYSNDVKKNVLGVGGKNLEEKGAVSQEVAIEMAEGALKLASSDYALAVTGVAGPSGGTENKPVGTVWCALSQKNSTTFSWKIMAKGRGKRASVIEYTANYILGALWRYIAHDITPREDER